MVHSETHKVYISYSRRGDTSLGLIRQLLKAARDSIIQGYEVFQTGCLDNDTGLVVARELAETGDLEGQAGNETIPAENEEIKNWEIAFDENSLQSGCSIMEFMLELSGANRIIILLSEGYFTSPYCMFELISLYEKNASTLLPVVVFVPSYFQVDEQKIITSWQEKKKEFTNQGKDQAAAFCNRIIYNLPLALTWLLGSYDEQFTNWDTLFHVIDGTKQTACDEILKALAKPVSLRYQFYSRAAKQEKIKEKMSNAVKKCDRHLNAEGLSQCFALLKDRLEKYSDNVQEKPEERPEEILALFREIAQWLTELQDEEITPKLCQIVGRQMQEITGLLLLDVFVDKKILQLLHELNRQKSFAHLALRHENDCMFQILVSALALAPAGFRWHKQDNSQDNKPSLKGKKELVMLETGINGENLYGQLNREQQHRDVYKNLFKQMWRICRPDTDPGTHDSPEEVLDIMCAYAESQAFYLVLDKLKLTTMQDEKDFRSHFAEKLPDITEVISGSSSGNKVQDYLIDGLTSGGLFAKINDIYGQSKKLQNQN